MKEKLLLVGALLLSALSFGQFKNPDFEMQNVAYQTFYGTPTSFDLNVPHWKPGCVIIPTNPNPGGSPDIFDRTTNAICAYKVPENKLALQKETNIPGTDRYVGISKNESIVGELEETLKDCEYSVDFYYSPPGQDVGCGSGAIVLPASGQLEFVLRNYTNTCNGPGDVVYTTPVMNLSPQNTTSWNHISGTFTLTSAQANMNYNAIEIRFKDGGGNWIYIDDLSLEKVDCCPPVDLVVNCETGTIELQGIPAGVTGVYTNWYKRKKFGGYQLISSSSGLQSSLNVTGNGTYLVEFQIILANGEVCTYSETVVYSEDACCELLGPTLDAWLLDNVLYYETVYSQTYGWSVQVPVLCNLDPHRVVEIATSSSCIDFYNYTNSKFDANTWTNIGAPLINVSGNGNPPGYIGLMYYNFATGNSEVAPNELNHFQLQTQAPYQVVDLLYIPTTICGKVTELISNEEQLAFYNFNAFPNPGKNQLKMSVSLDSEVMYSIVDISGRIVSTGSYFMNAELDVSQLSPGTYTIVSTIDGDTFNYKWIKE